MRLRLFIALLVLAALVLAGLGFVRTSLSR
jgi:hypothetical protein